MQLGHNCLIISKIITELSQSPFAELIIALKFAALKKLKEYLTLIEYPVWR
jgi:hypothetical protein